VKVYIDVVPVSEYYDQWALALCPEGFMDFNSVYALGSGWHAATTKNLRNVIAVLRLAGVEVELTSHAQRLLEEKP